MRPKGTDQMPIDARLAVALLALAAFFVFRGTLEVFFAQEDFRGLAVAAGVLPRHEPLWRYVSVQAFMDVTHPWFGNRAWPYHAAGLALHALNAGLLFAVLRRHAPRRRSSAPRSSRPIRHCSRRSTGSRRGPTSSPERSPC